MDTNGLSAWCIFHQSNKGFNFQNKNTGEIFTKMEIFLEYRKWPESLKQLTNNSHPTYCHIDKPGWQNGILVEAIEAREDKLRKYYSKKMQTA